MARMNFPCGCEAEQDRNGNWPIRAFCSEHNELVEEEFEDELEDDDE